LSFAIKDEAYNILASSWIWSRDGIDEMFFIEDFSIATESRLEFERLAIDKKHFYIYWAGFRKRIAVE